LAPERELLAASRIFLQEIEEHISAGEDFAFETTLAGRGYLRLIERLRNNGWRVELIYLALPGVEMSKMRVAERVAHGGHNIPIKDIERRFPRSLYSLLNLFSHRVDRCLCFMNDVGVPKLIFEQQGGDRKVINDDFFQTLLNEAAQ
jgi:predicted ABC-type ATPase